MGIFDRLTKLATTKEAKSYSPNGSIYAPNYVVTDGKVPESPLSTKKSKLHADDGIAGYSTGDDNKINNEVLTQAQQYDDGEDSFALPIKEKLHLHEPKSTTYISINRDQVTVNYTSERTYLMSFDPRTY